MPLQIIRQDITKMRVDAIVNTTNEEMVGYSGVDLAIHKAAGPELDKECARIAPLGLGTAKITNAYNLDAKYIIHTSGPVWQGGLVGESIILKSCYIESLKLAVANGCNSIAFPLISSGVYGYPKDQVLKFAIQIITEFLFDHEIMVYLCVIDRTAYEFSKKLFTEISEAIDDDYVDERENDFLGGAVETAIFAERTLQDTCIDAAPQRKSQRRELYGSARGKSLHEYRLICSTFMTTGPKRVWVASKSIPSMAYSRVSGRRSILIMALITAITATGIAMKIPRSLKTYLPSREKTLPMPLKMLPITVNTGAHLIQITTHFSENLRKKSIFCLRPISCRYHSIQ